MKITLAEIDSIIERGKQWTRNREAMRIMGAALRTPGAGRRLGDVLTAEQMELITMGCSARMISKLRSVGSTQDTGEAWRN